MRRVLTACALFFVVCSSKVLSDKVLEGYWSEEEAVECARFVLRENAIRVFALQPK